MASSATVNPSRSSDEQQCPSFPNNLSTVCVANFVSSKLSGDRSSNNYSSWKKQIRCLLDSQDLRCFINGTIPPPQKPSKFPSATANDGNNKAVWRTDKLVKGWILGSLSDNILKNVVNLTTARDVWLELKNIFTSSTPPDQTYEDEWGKYLPLYKATLKGDWGEAEQIINNDPNAINARIDFPSQTCLHIAVGTGKAIHFVEQLVSKMSRSDNMLGDQLKVKDQLGYTALHVAALTGNTEAAKILIRKCPDLPLVTENTGRYPVYLAALSAQRETLWYLISKTTDDGMYSGQTVLELLCTVIDTHMFDVALYLAEKYPELSTLRLPDGTSALGRIALAFSSGERSFNIWEQFISSAFDSLLEDTAILSNFWERIIYSVPRVKNIHRRKQIHQLELKLVKNLCKYMVSLDFKSASGIYAEVMLEAARLDAHEVIEEIVATFPTAIYSRNYSDQYIFHVAVENRSEKVFNLIYQMSDLKHHYLNKVDNSGNTLLHLAGRLAPSHKLNLVSGAALQMQRELKWFQEVQKLHPYSCERLNKVGKTPKMIFTEEHKQLKAEGEKWLKDTSDSCAIAAALIITVVFAAAITVPGGNESDKGFPILYTNVAFKIFALSDAIALFTSITSLLMFISISTSSYEEQDFLHTLPDWLGLGLGTLFISILSMLVAFSATVFLVFGRAEDYGILLPVAAWFVYCPIFSIVARMVPLFFLCAFHNV